MPNKTDQPYYSFVHEKPENLKEETFYEPSLFSWTSILENNYPIILEEISSFIQKDHQILKPYFAKDMMNEPDKWKAFSFYFWGIKMNKTAFEHCPQTIKLLSGIDNIVSASVSVMEPHSEIKPHYGDTDAIYRCHLGLIVPAGLPECGIRVGYEDRAWKEGKLIIFNDAAYHKTWNHTDKKRIVLIFDVIKPQFRDQQKWICSRVYGNIIWQTFSQATGIFKGRKNFITKSFSWLFALSIRVLHHSLKRKSA
jgi:ornithine lipid ester-linked acyl 2-hydroxylase